jgi:hypothetical protein
MGINLNSKAARGGARLMMHGNHVGQLRLPGATAIRGYGAWPGVSHFTLT